MSLIPTSHRQPKLFVACAFAPPPPPMPAHPNRRGFAYQRRGHHAAVNDGLGNIIRPGAAVFVKVNYTWRVDGTDDEGEAPARLYRIFHNMEDEDTSPDEALLFEYGFLWYFNSIQSIPGFDEHMDEETLAYVSLVYSRTRRCCRSSAPALLRGASASSRFPRW